MAIRYDENGNPYEDNEDPAVATNIDAENDAAMRIAVNQLYQAYLGRGVDSEAVMEAHLRNPGGIQGVGAAIANSDEYKKRQLNAAGTDTSDPPPADTPSPRNTVSPISTSPIDPTNTNQVPRTAANPFGSNAPAATDVGMSNMIEREKAGWKAYLKANWPKSLLDQDGNPDDPGALDGVIRQLSYASNAGQDPKKFLDQAVLTAKTRAQSGGDPSVTGRYNSNWNDLDPSRTSGRDPSAAYTTEMTSLQKQLDAERDPTKRNALQTKMAAMFNGAYVGPPQEVSTLSAITTPTPPAAARPTATQTSAPPMQPYSARATTPYTTGQTVTTAPFAPSAVTRQVPMAGMPTAPVNAMGNMLTPTPQNPYALANAWNTTNANYQQAGNAYAARMGGTYNPAPWAGTRFGAPRNALGTPTTVGSQNDVALATDAAERRRVYRFGVQNAQANQANAAMGQQDFNGQMDNWLRAYNDWNRKGVDPLTVPGGVI